MPDKTDHKILQVAQKHFVQKGFAGAKMQEIADDAQINKALLHYYFRSKDKLYEAVILQTLDEFIPKIAAAFESDGTIWQRIQKIVDTYIDLLSEMPHIPFFIMYELSQKRDTFIAHIRSRASLIPIIGQFAESLLKAMNDGEIKSFPPQHLFLNIIGLTVFPFMAKPIFCTAFEYSDEAFTALMQERKMTIMQFLQNALKPEQT